MQIYNKNLFHKIMYLFKIKAHLILEALSMKQKIAQLWPKEVIVIILIKRIKLFNRNQKHKSKIYNKRIRLKREVKNKMKSELNRGRNKKKSFRKGNFMIPKRQYKNKRREKDSNYKRCKFKK